MILLFFLILEKGVKKSEELKAPYYANTAAIHDYITTRNIIPNIFNYFNLNFIAYLLKNFK